MSSGTQVDLDWTGVADGQGGATAPPANSPAVAGGGTTAYLSDEEILGIAPVGQTLLSVPESSTAAAGATKHSSDAAHPSVPRLEGQAGVPVLHEMPQWMQAAAGDPQHGVEAQQLWQEHQAFRASFSSPEEARAIKEIFPGGAQEAQTLKQAAQSVDRIDAAIFSGDARAQSEVVAELARANPAAFRSLFAEAAKVLEVGGSRLEVGRNEAGGREAGNVAVARLFRGGEVARAQEKNPGSEDPGYSNPPSSAVADFGGPGPRPSQEIRGGESQITNHDATAANHQSPATSHPSQDLRASQSPPFDPAAYASFERSTNDVVARDVRTSIQDTLARVLPEGIADGASRRIGEDIFNEIHRALAGDRALSEQVGQALREPLAAGQGWRFGTAEQQRVASLLAGRAKQLVPSVARRVIGEWTSSVLGTARSKAARQAAAASRVDIAAAGGSLDSMPLRAMSPREVDYASMSDDEILSL